jgi:hypothetical protein
LTAIGADNDIRPGIDALYEMIRSNKFRVFDKTSPHFLDEVSMYHYPAPADITADKDVKETLPVKQHDHSLDAIRYPVYALSKTKGYFNKRAPVSPKHKDIDYRLHVVDDMLRKGIDNEEYDW